MMTLSVMVLLIWLIILFKNGITLFQELHHGIILYRIVCFYLFVIAACAAAKRAIGTRNGEQET